MQLPLFPPKPPPPTEGYEPPDEEPAGEYEAWCDEMDADGLVIAGVLARLALDAAVQADGLTMTQLETAVAEQFGAPEPEADEPGHYCMMRRTHIGRVMHGMGWQVAGERYRPRW